MYVLGWILQAISILWFVPMALALKADYFRSKKWWIIVFTMLAGQLTAIIFRVIY